MRNYIVTKHPKYTFEDEATTALLIVDGKLTDIYGLSSVSRKQFSKLEFKDKDLSVYIKKYGDAAKNGVFEIETKNFLAEKWLAEIIAVDSSHKLKQMISSRGFDYSRLMIILNGRELITEFFNEPKIDVKSISSMDLESFGGIYGGMLTIETGKVALYGNSDLEKAGIATAVAVQKEEPIIVKATGFEVRLPSKTSQASIPEVTTVLATTTAAIPTPDATTEPVVKKKIEDKKVYPFQSVDVMASFPGCESEPNRQSKYLCFQKTLIKHVIKNFRYPEKAMDDGIQGSVIVKFEILKDGSIGNISIIRGVNADLDNEAIRIVNKIPNIKPAKVDGKNVKVSTILPITFKLT